MKRFSRAVSFVLAVLLVFSASGLTINAMAISSDEPDVTKGNVPVTFTPNSEITFDADGNYEITNVGTPLPVSRSTGEEIGGNLADQDPDAYDAANQAMLEQFESLPVFMFEEYYIAGEGAVALYDQDGELIRVRGDYEYYSTLDQYMVNGSLPDGKYIGTYSEFSQITNKSNDSRAVASTITQSGRFTTYGDYWPVIDETEWPDCNTDPVPNGPVYGDRIGTKNNRLEVGDVALKKSAGVPYDSKIIVTVQDSDTNGHGSITKELRVRDTMSASANSVLDIWRWDSPEWFTGTPQKPNDLYFGQTYITSRSFTNKSNYWTY